MSKVMHVFKQAAMGRAFVHDGGGPGLGACSSIELKEGFFPYAKEVRRLQLTAEWRLANLSWVHMHILVH
jgi:hypothetical protein